MSFRIIKILLLALLACGLSCCSSSCSEPQKADLKTYLPVGTLIYLETDDLSRVSGVFTGNKDWRALSSGGNSSGSGEGYLTFLQNKQAALAVIGFQNSEEGAILQVRPDLALVIDTQSSQSQATAIAEKVLLALSRRFSGEDAGVAKQTLDGAEWLTAPGSDGKKIYVTVSGAVIVIANSETALKRCLEVKRGNGESLTGNKELLLAREQHGIPDRIAFGYVSSAGIKELSNYLAVSYALKSSENSLTREMISGILPEIMQKAVGSIAWSAKATDGGVEDTYFIKTNKEFADTVFQTVKVSPSEDRCDSAYLPREVYSATCYRLENPQIAWRGAVLSLAKQLDPRAVGLFNEFSRQLLKPYGIDDPELFLSAAGTQIITARFDADGNSAAAIVKVKNKDAIKRAIAETFAAKKSLEFLNNAELWKSREGDFGAAFVGEDDLIIGNMDAVTSCLMETKYDPNARPKPFGDFLAPGAAAVAVVVTRQKDDSRLKILANMANRSVEGTSYAFIETRIGPDGITRRSISAFGLFGEIFRQAVE